MISNDDNNYINITNDMIEFIVEKEKLPLNKPITITISHNDFKVQHIIDIKKWFYQTNQRQHWYAAQKQRSNLGYNYRLPTDHEPSKLTFPDANQPTVAPEFKSSQFGKPYLRKVREY